MRVSAASILSKGIGERRTRSTHYLVLVLFSLASLAYAQSPLAVSQGHYLSFQHPNATALEFNGTTVPCHQNHCLAAVEADASTGAAIIMILAKGTPALEQSIVVTAKPFLVEPLPLSSDVKALFKVKGREEEVRVIKQALRTESSERLWSKAFLKPVDGAMESPYGERRTIDGKPKPGYHRGVDLKAPLGTPVRSTNEGRVVLAGRFIEEGNMVIVDHGQGVTSAYLHMSKIRVKTGQRVRAGQTLGDAGSTGVSNSPHLHFGLYLHGAPVDPMHWLESSSALLKE